MFTLPDPAHAALVGIGATAVMDLWLLLQQRLGLPTGSFAMVGRWVGHLASGRVAHAAIGKAPAVAHEGALGWALHYAVGIVFAALLLAIEGRTWFAQPAFVPALLFGIATVVFPLFVMQPAMGAGLASSKTATPFRNCLRSVANHAVFGAGLYLAAALIAAIHHP